MNKILIVGALGAVGRCALEHFDGASGWEVVGAARVARRVGAVGAHEDERRRRCLFLAP